MAGKSAELTRPGGELTRSGEGSVKNIWLVDTAGWLTRPGRVKGLKIKKNNICK
ncbi:hypothetical protein HanRHA438_Chr14g0657821 [Helianthus annuus]|nr:hypothetical protein HanRHA438_Chr14g0657821 [Helianthus annuus]